MSDVEGVTAEETTAVESVENTTPEKVETPTEAETEVEATELADEPSQDGEDAEVDWKARAEEAEAKAKELETKTKRQTAANKATQERYEEAIAERKKLHQEILELKKPNIDDFDTAEEFEKADSEYQDKLVENKAEIKAQEIEAQKAAEAQVAQARDTFAEKEAAFKAENTDYVQNTAVVQEYINMIDPQDAGFQEFGKYIAFECDNAPALLNDLGKHPEKIEALLGKPPALVKRKLQAYAKDLSAPKVPAQTDPLPKPPSKTKGSAQPKNLHSGDVLKNLGLK